MNPIHALGALALIASAAASALPKPDCRLSGGRTHASVAGKMHIAGTCRSLAGQFAPDASCAIPPGYRRPKANEITAAAVQKSNSWLRETPSDGIWLSTDLEAKKGNQVLRYRFRTEYHCHNPGERGPQGWHKGVTVYVATGPAPKPQPGDGKGKAPPQKPGAPAQKAPPAAKAPPAQKPSGGGPSAAGLPAPDCKLSGGRTHASVAGKMHIAGTCRSLAGQFAPEASCAIPPGYRRPKANEVNAAVVKKSSEWLSGTPSTGIWLSTDMDVKKGSQTVRYRFRTEYHCHNPGERGPQGWHKGVTVYVKK